MLTTSLKAYEPEPGWICQPPNISNDGLTTSLKYQKKLSSGTFSTIILRLCPIVEGIKSRVGIKLDIPPSQKTIGKSAARNLVAKIKSELTQSQ